VEERLDRSECMFMCVYVNKGIHLYTDIETGLLVTEVNLEEIVVVGGKQT
jgi:hypothetical protein